MTADVLLALRLIERRAAGKPDRHADAGTVRHAARVLRGVR